MNGPTGFTLLQQAVAHHQAGRLGPAEALYREVLRLDPNSADALHLLGVIALQSQRLEAAAELIGLAIARGPASAPMHRNLGETRRQLGQLAEAERSFRQALALQPDLVDALNSLGALLWQTGRLDEAAHALQRVAALGPESVDACLRVAAVERARDRSEAAVAWLQRALSLQPGHAVAHHQLGKIFHEQRNHPAALAHYRQAVAAQPDYVEAHYNLGNVLRGTRQIDLAAVAFERTIELKPGFTEAHFALGEIYKDRAELDRAIASYRRAQALQPGSSAAHSNLVYTLHFHPAAEAAAIRDEHRLWRERFAAPLAAEIRPHRNSRDADRRLRVGYVSPDFRLHAECFFVLPLLEAHDRKNFEVHAYASVRQPDAITARHQRSCDAWHEVRARTDAELAEQIRADGIDILVDLTMHMADNRLPVFARRPAPVQVTWLAYPATTGLDAIDYRLTDAQLEPAGDEYPFSAETPVRLPAAWCCYDPLADPACGELPALRRGHITFGSLNNFCKVNEPVLRRWARLLVALPDSTLLLLCPEGAARERTRALLAAAGVAPARVDFVSMQSRPDYLRTFQRIDIGLDPFPYNGITTTLDALWMGVPVLTHRGALPPARVGASLLTALGLPEFIAASETDDARIVVEFARDRPRLAALRAGLRERMQRSPLMDGPGFARGVEAAYRTMWRRWCASPSG